MEVNMFGTRFFHGMVTGVIVGGAITALVHPMDKRSYRNLKRKKYTQKIPVSFIGKNRHPLFKCNFFGFGKIFLFVCSKECNKPANAKKRFSKSYEKFVFITNLLPTI